MGLDTYLSVRKKLSEKEKMCIKLGSKKPESKEICYWRKERDIVELFGKVLGIVIENVTEYIITKEQLEKIYENELGINHLDKQIEKALKKINWETQEVIFYNWW